MALNNSQYQTIMRAYEQKQSDARNQLNARTEEVYQKMPDIEQLDQSISKLSIEQARKILNGDEQALFVLREDIRELSSKRAQLLEQGGFPKNYLDAAYDCFDCQDTGYLNQDKCRCFKKLSIDLLYQQSNLRQVLDIENFESFSLTYYSDNYIDPLTGSTSLDIMKKAFRVCKDFSDTFFDPFSNLFLYGDPGVGKTFLSHCIAKDLMDRSYSVIYFTAFDLFDTFAKSNFEKNHNATLMSDHILDCDLLIIDDLGTELSNSFTASQLFICVNERMLKEKPTIISTNLSLDDFKNVYSERVFSRISSHYTMLRLIGDDIRIKKKLMNKEAISC